MELQSIQFENVRNFTNATLDLSKPTNILVGRNNSGKTSALKILDWIFNGPSIDELWDDEFTDEHHDILIPARNSQKKARRVTLYVKITDGRSKKKYLCDKKGICVLRFKVYRQPFSMTLKLGKPKQGEGRDHDAAAIHLLNALRKHFVISFIPSFRDASSERFEKSLDSAFQDTLAERALHSGRQGGAPSEYRKVKKIGTDLVKMAEQLTNPVVKQIQNRAPNGMLVKAKINLKSGPEEIIEWLTSQLEIKLVTGGHDEESVSALNVGSGLQSILDVALHSSKNTSDTRKHILMIEEPEAFLHPSAQRLISRDIVNFPEVDKLIVTTHSPIVVEEAGFDPIQIAADQEFFSHKENDPRRITINSALLHGHGAEMIFAKSVLFVEGDGDRQFYEALRRRIASADVTGKMDQLFVIPTGSKTSFIPWLKLLKSYEKNATNKPIQWVAVLDGDASTDVRELLKDIYGAVKNSANIALGELSAAHTAASAQGRTDPTTVSTWFGMINNANGVMQSLGYPIVFHKGDLEYCSLNNIGEDSLTYFSEALEKDFDNSQELVKYLGSKGIDGKSSQNSLKAPWVRGMIGGYVPKSEVSKSTIEIVRKWMLGVMTKAEATRLLKIDW